MTTAKSKERQQFRKIWKSGMSKNWKKGKGYSLSLVIPKSFTEQLCLHEDSIMSLKLKGSKIILEKSVALQ